MWPADFYTGVVAELYEPLKSESPDPAEYGQFIEQYGEPALELGCGDGEPLLDLRKRGFDVERIAPPRTCSLGVVAKRPRLESNRSIGRAEGGYLKRHEHGPGHRG